MLLSLGMGGDSPEVQEGTEVVIPGEGPEQLHHFRHVLLSTRPRERGKTDWVLFGTPSHLTPTPEHPSFFLSNSVWSWKFLPRSCCFLKLQSLRLFAPKAIGQERGPESSGFGEMTDGGPCRKRGSRSSWCWVEAEEERAGRRGRGDSSWYWLLEEAGVGG